MSGGGVLTVARWTLLEMVRRRLAVTGGVLSAAFIALFVVGAVALEGWLGDPAASGGDEGFAVGAIGILTVFGLYAVQFLSSFLAVLLATSAVSPEISSGALHAVLVRPLGRAQFLAGRLLTLTGLVAGYVVVMAGAVLLTARVVGGYTSLDPVRAVALMILEAMVLVAAGLLASTRLPTAAGGVVLFSLYGLAWLAGIIETVGGFVDNQRMVDVGVAVSLLFPTDAVWRGASWFAQPPLVASGDFGEIPFFSQTPPTAALVSWAAAHAVLALTVAVVAFRRRDL